MIVDDPNVPRGERFSALVDLGLAAWAARWPLYVAIAAASIGFEYLAALAARFNADVAAIVLCCVDAFAMAFVSLDVVARFRGETPPARRVARAAAKRWPIVALVLIVVLFLEMPLFPWMFGSAEETLYGMLVLPALAMLGIFGICTVVAAIDDSVPLPALPLYAILRSVLVAAAWPNLGRLTVAGAMTAVPLMAQQLVEHWLGTKSFSAEQAFFWANVPIDAVCLAPFQAFFTYLYLDFVVREQRR